MDDMISRQAAIDAIVNITVFDNSNSIKDACERVFLNDNGWLGGIKDSIESIEALPSAQRKGKWTEDEACEFCGFQPWYENDIHTLSFCPNCGASMKGVSNDEVH